MKFLSRALVKLGVDEFYLEFDGTPSDSDEMSQALFKLNSEGEFDQGLGTIDHTWAEIKAKADELEAAEPLRLLREERNRILRGTDWVKAPDVSLSNDSDWTVYRQALRDMPQNYSSLDSAQGNWPTEPS